MFHYTTTLIEGLEEKGDENWDKGTKTGIVKAILCWFGSGFLDGTFLLGGAVVLTGYVIMFSNWIHKRKSH